MQPQYISLIPIPLWQVNSCPYVEEKTLRVAFSLWLTGGAIDIETNRGKSTSPLVKIRAFFLLAWEQNQKTDLHTLNWRFLKILSTLFLDKCQTAENWPIVLYEWSLSWRNEWMVLQDKRSLCLGKSFSCSESLDGKQWHHVSLANWLEESSDGCRSQIKWECPRPPNDHQHTSLHILPILGGSYQGPCGSQSRNHVSHTSSYWGLGDIFSFLAPWFLKFLFRGRNSKTVIPSLPYVSVTNREDK